MRWRSSFRAGRGRLDGMEDMRREQSLQTRDDDPTKLPDTDDDDDLPDNDPDTDTEDDDDNPPPTGLPPPPPPGPNTSTRSIPTLTPIAHTSKPFSSTTTRATTTTSVSSPATFSASTITSTARRQAATSLAISTTVGSAILTSNSGQTSAMSVLRPEQSGQPVLGTPSRAGLSPGAKAGIAIGIIAAVALFASLCFLLLKHRRSRSSTPAQSQPEDGLAPPPPRSQSQSQILADLMAAANAAQNGHPDSHTYLSEKLPARPMPAAREGDQDQPEIRRSIASWLRRHHPLNLNPQDGGRASTAAASASLPKTPKTASSPRTTISLDSPERKPKAENGKKDRFVSVWSDSTPESVSEGGNTELLSMYGRGFDSIRGTWILPPRPRDSEFQSGRSMSGYGTDRG